MKVLIKSGCSASGKDFNEGDTPELSDLDAKILKAYGLAENYVEQSIVEIVSETPQEPQPVVEAVEATPADLSEIIAPAEPETPIAQDDETPPTSKKKGK